jgi:hypothetical protein
MRRRRPVLFAFLALVLLLIALVPACRKMPERTAVLPTETLTDPTMVPAAWGDLEAVSSVADHPDLVQLYFQDEQGTIRRVVMRVQTGELLNVFVIKRN